MWSHEVLVPIKDNNKAFSLQTKTDVPERKRKLSSRAEEQGDGEKGQLSLQIPNDSMKTQGSNEKFEPIRKRRKIETDVSSKTDAANPGQVSERRYPKRKERVDYTEAEVPDDDHYLCKYQY